MTSSQDLFSRYGDRAQIPPRRDHIKNCQETFYPARDPVFRALRYQAGFLNDGAWFHGLPSEKFDKFGDDLFRRFFH